MVRKKFSDDFERKYKDSFEYFCGIRTLNVVFNQLTSINYAICKMAADFSGYNYKTKPEFRRLHVSGNDPVDSLSAKEILEKNEDVSDYVSDFLREQLTRDAGNVSGRLSFGHPSATGINTANAELFREFLVRVLPKESIESWIKMIECMDKYSSTAWVYDKLVTKEEIEKKDIECSKFEWLGDDEPEWYKWFSIGAKNLIDKTENTAQHVLHLHLVRWLGLFFARLLEMAPLEWIRNKINDKKSNFYEVSDKLNELIEENFEFGLNNIPSPLYPQIYECALNNTLGRESYSKLGDRLILSKTFLLIHSIYETGVWKSSPSTSNLTDEGLEKINSLFIDVEGKSTPQINNWLEDLNNRDLDKNPISELEAVFMTCYHCSKEWKLISGVEGIIGTVRPLLSKVGLRKGSSDIIWTSPQLAETCYMALVTNANQSVKEELTEKMMFIGLHPGYQFSTSTLQDFNLPISVSIDPYGSDPMSENCKEFEKYLIDRGLVRDMADGVTITVV